MNRHYSENLPSPLFAKEGLVSSLCKREVRRDFIKQCPHYFTTKATADEAGEDEPVGTGLGLYMVRELLKKYQAEFDIKSLIGKGTTFTVKFPILCD